MSRSLFGLSLLVISVLSACAEPRASSVAPATSTAEPTAAPTPDPVKVVAVGDIASCDRDGDADTAALVDDSVDAIAIVGDLVYPAGSDATYRDCYGPTWGAFLGITYPTTGNHDLRDDGGTAYFDYFGDRAGAEGKGWYSYDIGDWHAVALNSHCDLVGCDLGSEQYEWLAADLERSDARCTLAYWHHPRFSSGPDGEFPVITPFWQALHVDGAELVLVGHDHLYERFSPQTPSGKADAMGIRQFTVGTGGYEPHAAERVAPNSEFIYDDGFGILELTLHADSYDWRFVAVGGEELDTGSARCH